MLETLQNMNPILLAGLKVAILVVPILMLVPGLIWWERRLLSWMQDRIGPNRSGTITLASGKKIRTFGLLQPILDGVKLFFKEDVTPNSIDRKIYFIAPAVALFPAFVLGGTMPFAPSVGIWEYLTPVADIEIGLLFVLAISSLGVYGVVLAGYASNNKYSLMGGLRASAQLISYELAMGVALLAIVFASGSLKMTTLVEIQEAPLFGTMESLQNWFFFTPYGFISAIIFFICMIAETNRAPFDLPEAENELIAGYHTEYSSMKFAVFFMGEYAAMFIFSGIFTCVFFGGYNLLPVNFEYLAANASFGAGMWEFLGKINVSLAPLWFVGKMAFFFSTFIWIRATLPRLRYDQLMSLGWKTLLPVAVANFIVVGLWMIITDLKGITSGWITYGGAMILLVLLYLQLVAAKKRASDSPEKRTITMVDPGASS